MSLSFSSSYSRNLQITAMPDTVMSGSCSQPETGHLFGAAQYLERLISDRETELRPVFPSPFPDSKVFLSFTRRKSGVWWKKQQRCLCYAGGSRTFPAQGKSSTYFFHQCSKLENMINMPPLGQQKNHKLGWDFIGFLLQRMGNTKISLVLISKKLAAVAFIILYNCLPIPGSYY